MFQTDKHFCSKLTCNLLVIGTRIMSNDDDDDDDDNDAEMMKCQTNE